MYQVAQVLAGAALPGETPGWQVDMLKAIGVGTQSCNLQLTRSDPMFDWRLVAAVRILCASSDRDLLGLDTRQLGSLEASLSPDVEVCLELCTSCHATCPQLPTVQPLQGLPEPSLQP